MKFIGIICGAMGLLAAPALAQDEAGLATHPTWAERPDPYALSELAPKFAMSIGLQGRVRLSCSVSETGALLPCRVYDAQPEGLGFDRAALSASPLYRFNAGRDEQGRPQTQPVRFSVQFSYEAPEYIVDWDGETPHSPERIEALRNFVRADFRTTGFEKIEDGFRELDVDVDRIPAVLAMIDKAQHEYLDEYLEARTLSLSRVLDPADLEIYLRGETPSRPLPSGEEWQASAPEYARWNMKVSTRVRQLYCAQFNCSITDE